MVPRICEITATLVFIFRLMLCSHGDVSFKIVCLNMVEGIKEVYLLMWFKKKTRLETPFKCDSVKALIKTSNGENLVENFSEKVKKYAAFAILAILFWFSVTKQSPENSFGFPH